MASPELDVAGCGSMVVDIFYRAPRVVAADEKILLEPHRGGEFERRQIGGVALNHLGWARVMGLRVGVFGKMGPDSNGAFLRKGVEDFGFETHLTLDGSASSFAPIIVDSRGGRAIYMCRGATGELRPDEVRGHHGDFIRRAKLISTEISQLPLKTVVAILQIAHDNSIPSILDVDIAPSDACHSLGTRVELDRALRLATILKPSKAAARQLTTSARNMGEVARAVRERYGSSAVVVTDGPNGCAVAAENTSIRVPAFKVRVVDTTGAGDAFLGAMIAGLKWKMSWTEIGRLGNAAGAVCAGQLGAFPSSIALRAKVEKLYGGALPRLADSKPPRFGSAALASSESALEVELDRFFDLAIDELCKLRANFDLESIWRAAQMIRNVEAAGGRVHVTGVGKPEHIARYAASLFCSVGTIATFLHATETLHGSLGQVHANDVVIAISKSGNTEEICAVAIAIKEHGARLIAVTGNSDSTLAGIADLVLRAPIDHEGGLLGLAPRVSILAETMVLAGLSVALEAARGLTHQEYSRWHRAGALGEAARRLAAGRASQRKLKAIQ
jgi:sugar/nucleoside kinase (ribokinase family)/D-arabinose 5-phosphate isomerase GutQ